MNLSHSHIQINIQNGALHKDVEYTLLVRISTYQTHDLFSVNPCFVWKEGNNSFFDRKKVTIEFKLIGNA